MLGLNTLATRKLRADMVEVYTILRDFEGTDDITIFQRRVGGAKGHDFKLFKNLLF